MNNMDVEKLIRERKSVRTFDASRKVEQTTVEAMKEAVGRASSPFDGAGFDGRYRIELKEFDFKGPLRPSTYGVIAGASWYLLMGIAPGEMSSLAAGYAMEEVVLRATELGLGTCWMAMTFKGADFASGADMPADMPLRIISPVGYGAEKRRLLESLTRVVAGSSRRRPMGELFSEGEFGSPIAEDNKFYSALDMMHLAPSAKNTQPWRALVKGDTVWFYYENKSEASVLDVGIGLCHFDLTLKSQGRSGRWEQATDAPHHATFVPVVKYTLDGVE